MRLDRFRTGDEVLFIPGKMGAIHKRLTKDNGPYLIQKTQNVPKGTVNARHSQLVTVSGVLYSGVWFKPKN